MDLIIFFQKSPESTDSGLYFSAGICFQRGENRWIRGIFEKKFLFLSNEARCTPSSSPPTARSSHSASHSLLRASSAIANPSELQSYELQGSPTSLFPRLKINYHLSTQPPFLNRPADLFSQRDDFSVACSIFEKNLRFSPKIILYN